MSDIKNILKEIKQLNDSIDVFIPSLKQTIKIKQLSVKQCKDIINMPPNILHAQYAFFRKIYSILKENVPEYADEFNIVDRVAIILALRAKAMDKYEELSITNDILPQLPNITYDLVAPTIETKNYIFSLSIPTLKSEDHFNKFIMNTFKMNKLTNVEEIESVTQEIFGELAVIEICKYISNISIKGQDMDIDMNILSPTQRKEIVESIQIEELKQVIEFNNKVHTTEANFTTFNINDKVTTVEIGPEFFVFI